MTPRSPVRTFRSVVPVPLLVLLTAVAVAATSSVMTTPAGGGLALVARSWTPPGEGGSPDQAAAARAAQAEAQWLVGLVSRGPGWTPATAPPASSLGAPMSYPAVFVLADAYLLWSTPAPWSSVLDWVRNHPPAGSTPAGSGSSWEAGIEQEADLGFSFPATVAFESRQVVVAAVPLAGGATGIRADAQVVWYPPRPAAESVSTGADSVTVRVFERSGAAEPGACPGSGGAGTGGGTGIPGSGSVSGGGPVVSPVSPPNVSAPASSGAVPISGAVPATDTVPTPMPAPAGSPPVVTTPVVPSCDAGGPPLLAQATFSDFATVQKLAGWVNALPTAVPGVSSCPAETGSAPWLTMAFSGPLGIPRVTVVDDSGACGGVGFTVDGVRQPDLGGGDLFARVIRLLRLGLPATAGTG